MYTHSTLLFSKLYHYHFEYIFVNSCFGYHCLDISLCLLSKTCMLFGLQFFVNERTRWRLFKEEGSILPKI